MNRRIALAALGMAVLAGCTGVPVARPAAPGQVVGTDADSPQAMAQRQRIERLGLADGDCSAPAWALTGRVALSNGKDGGSGRITWSQAAGEARIELTAPVTRQGPEREKRGKRRRDRDDNGTTGVGNHRPGRVGQGLGGQQHHEHGDEGRPRRG